MCAFLSLPGGCHIDASSYAAVGYVEATAVILDGRYDTYSGRFGQGVGGSGEGRIVPLWDSTQIVVKCFDSGSFFGASGFQVLGCCLGPVGPVRRRGLGRVGLGLIVPNVHADRGPEGGMERMNYEG